MVEDTHVFSPKHHDDRFVLGIKGTMSERELFTNRDRMLKAARNKAARGELCHRVPIGYVREGQRLVKDPHEGVRHAIEAVFARFREQGTARQAAGGLARCGREAAREAARGGGGGVVGSKLLARAADSDESDAGGGVRVREASGGDGAERERAAEAEGAARADGRVAGADRGPPRGLPELGRVAGDSAAAGGEPAAPRRPGAVREGRALLQGVAVCGHCGRAMTVHYRQAPVYVCRTAAVAGNARLVCQSLGGKRVDELVAREFLEVMTPAGVAAALRAERDRESRRKAALRSHELELQRCEYNQSRAERCRRSHYFGRNPEFLVRLACRRNDWRSVRFRKLLWNSGFSVDFDRKRAFSRIESARKQL